MRLCFQLNQIKTGRFCISVGAFELAYAHCTCTCRLIMNDNTRQRHRHRRRRRRRHHHFWTYQTSGSWIWMSEINRNLSYITRQLICFSLFIWFWYFRAFDHKSRWFLRCKCHNDNLKPFVVWQLAICCPISLEKPKFLRVYVKVWHSKTVLPSLYWH